MAVAPTRGFTSPAGPDRGVHRRGLLRTLGAAALAGPVAGCASLGRGDGSPTPAATPTAGASVAPRPLDGLEGRWPQFQHDARNTGRHPTAVGPREPPTVRWRTTLGAGAATGPAVADGTVFVPRVDGVLFALDARTGAERWRVGLGAGVVRGHGSTPAVVDGTVYVGDAAGVVTALDAGTGAVRWTRSTGGRVDSSPTVVDGTVYVGSDDGRLYALDAADGDVVWTAPVGGRVAGAPAVHDGLATVGSSNGRVRAVATADGAERWTFAADDGVEAAPAVRGDRVVVGSRDGRLYALDAADGEVVWSRFFPFAGIAQTAALAGPLVLVSTLSFQLHAVDADTGDEVWNFTTGQVGWPVVADDTAYVAGGTVRALDLETGAPRWTRQRRGVGLAVVDDVLVAPTAKGEVFAFGP